MRGGVPGHRVTTGTACGGQADRESHCPRHVVLSLLLTSSPLTPHFFFFSTLPCPTSFHSHFCLLLGISVCLTMVLQVLFPIEQPHSFSGKLLSKTQNDDFSHTTNVSKYITSILFSPPCTVFNKDHFHPLKSESKHRNVLLKMLGSV